MSRPLPGYDKINAFAVLMWDFKSRHGRGPAKVLILYFLMKNGKEKGQL